MRRRNSGLLILCALAGTALIVGLVPANLAAAAPRAAARAHQHAPKMPDRITDLTVSRGPGVGEFTVRWKTSGKHTSKFRVDTALSMFAPSGKGAYPKKGRHFRHFYFGKEKRAHVFTRHQLRRAGAPLASGNHLYFRLYAIHKVGDQRSVRAFPYERAARPAGMKSDADGARITVANYNVGTTNPRDAHHHYRAWSVRGPKVARQIVAKHPGIVTIQELSPGPMNHSYRGARHQGAARHAVAQTVELVTYLHRAGGKSYRLVRDSSYTYDASGIQGARILYDTSRYRLVGGNGQCPDLNSRGQELNRSCAFQIPKLASDGQKQHRWAAYAHFEDLATGKRFWVVSAHLDHRNGSNLKQGRKFEKLRGWEVKHVVSKMNRLRHGEPVVLGMDQNSWQNTRNGFDPHNVLISSGYYDTSAATRVHHLKYATKIKRWNVARQRGTKLGYGARLDVLATLGIRGADLFETLLHPWVVHPGSDHNMILAQFRLPRS